ncbi:MAG: hypothetical protein IJX47_05320 [Clostridia bacterium]|nr:hypothetical protein [Clostridia bacterium]
METIFRFLLNRSIAVSCLILLIAILRSVWKRAPKRLLCALWAFVGIRLVLPFSFVGVWSLLPNRRTVPDLIERYVAAEPPRTTHLESAPPAGSDYFTNLPLFLSILWAVGVATLLIYAVLSYLRLRRRVAERVYVRDNVYLCDHISTPFILGIFQPNIYLPSFIHADDIEYVVEHEKVHIERYDHYWKPLGFLLLSVYWFNPVMWLGFWLFCKDIELACDARVLWKWGESWKKPYSSALLRFSSPQRSFFFCQLAFGEISVKERIMRILRYKYTTRIATVVSVILAIVVAFGFMTDPVTPPRRTWGESDYFSKWEIDHLMDVAVRLWYQQMGYKLELTEIEYDERWYLFEIEDYLRSQTDDYEAITDEDALAYIREMDENGITVMAFIISFWAPDDAEKALVPNYEYSGATLVIEKVNGIWRFRSWGY